MKRTAEARWNGGLMKGNGTMRLGSGAYEGKYSFGSRFEEAPGTNPEELIGAAHAGCFSMALSGALGKEGHDPQSVETRAVVKLEKQEAGFAITGIQLTTHAVVPGIAAEEFLRIAESAKENCPVSRALASVPIALTATVAGE
jgi:osmotically inducible protein OsmC